MRVRILTLMMLVSVAVLQPRLSWAEDSPTLEQRWTQFTVMVKTTVTELWNRWMGPAPAPAQNNRAVASTPTSPAPIPPTVQLAAPAQPAAPASAPAAQAPVPKVTPAQSPADQIKQVRQTMQDKSPFVVKSEGHAHDAKLRAAKSGVPLYDFHQLKKVKAIPLLDVGLEPEISHQNFSLPDWDWKIKQLQSVEKSPSPSPLTPQEAAELKMPLPKAQPPKLSAMDKNALDGSVTHEKVAKIDWQIKDVPDVQLKAYTPMSDDEVKMLVTRILFAKGNKCHLVLGLADDLSGKAEFKNLAQFEVGACAKQLKMNQVAFDKLSEVIRRQDPELGPQALTALAKDLPTSYEQAFYELVKKVDGKEEYFADKHVRNEIFYRAAKGAFKSGEFKAAEKWALRVDASSSFGPSAQYVVGLSQFGLKDKSAARATLEKLAQNIGSGDSVLKGLVDIDLARMDFVSHKYDAALPLYLHVPKDHPLWVQALIEQGWTQLAVEDYAGAIGNMYSLHSPYFKVLYQPQSFVVRTVGYLNICQYGDAYRTLTKLESDYRDWENRLGSYMTSQRTPASVYETVKSYLRSKSNTDVDGLPYQVVREAARTKEFLNYQDAINNHVDETTLFAGVSDRIRKDQLEVRQRAERAKKRADHIAAEIAAAKKAGTSVIQIDAMKRDMEKERTNSVPNRYELALLEQSLQAFGRFQKASQARIAESDRALAAAASKVLYGRMKGMQTEIARVLDNNEFLRYEIFAGSGENIRYQVAGGQVNGENRLPASVKPQKMMNWSFDGEFWADEIGNYRSSLKNNCPKNPTKARDQASRGEE